MVLWYHCPIVLCATVRRCNFGNTGHTDGDVDCGNVDLVTLVTLIVVMVITMFVVNVIGMAISCGCFDIYGKCHDVYGAHWQNMALASVS